MHTQFTCIHDLDNWKKNPLENFRLKNCLLRASNIVKNGDNGKLVYSVSVIAFDGKGSWIFGNYFARNLILIITRKTF